MANSLAEIIIKLTSKKSRLRHYRTHVKALKSSKSLKDESDKAKFEFRVGI